MTATPLIFGQSPPPPEPRGVTTMPNDGWDKRSLAAALDYCQAVGDWKAVRTITEELLNWVEDAYKRIDEARYALEG